MHYPSLYLVRQQVRGWYQWEAGADSSQHFDKAVESVSPLLFRKPRVGCGMMKSPLSLILTGARCARRERIRCFRIYFSLSSLVNLTSA